jgi:aspartyl/glutamyl-tRNA(Asn/Gln) amidotransferase C subunit
MVDKKEISHIAQLARIELDEKHISKIQKDMEGILDYVEKLKEVDVSEVLATSHSIEMKNVLRTDEVILSDPDTNDLIKQDFVSENGDYVKVKSVFGDGN